MRYFVIILVIAFIAAALIIAFISPIAKWYVEKNSEKLFGRKVKIGWLYLNPFTGFVNAHNVLAYERQSTDSFIAIGNLATNVTVRKLFSKNYDLTSVTLDHLWMHIIQNDSVFNFDDLIATDSTKSAKMDTIPVHFYIHKIRIKNSEFHYDELSIPVHYYITKVDLKSDFVDWNVDTTVVDYSFASGIGSGTVNGRVIYNFKDEHYNVHTVVKKFDLKVLEQYIKDFANYGTFSAFLDADMNAAGSLKNNLELAAHGKIAINDFHFGKTPKEDYASFKKFSMQIDSLNPADKKYFFSSLIIDTPYIKYEQYDSLDNFTAIFGTKASNVKQASAEHHNVNIIFVIADYIRDLAKNIVNSQYRLNEFKIEGAHILYNDYSLAEKFSLSANPLLITAKDIDTRNKRMYASVQTKLNPFGNVVANLDINPNDFGDFNLHYELRNMPLPLLNPYIITYTSHPFHKGKIELFGQWNVVNKQITSDNHLLLIHPTLAHKIKTRTLKIFRLP